MAHVPLRFTSEDIAEMRRLLAEGAVYAGPGVEPDSTVSVVRLCFHWLRRTAPSCRTAGLATLFGWFLGRVQELLGGRGGREAWWQTFEPLLVTGDWNGVLTMIVAYRVALGLPPQEAEAPTTRLDFQAKPPPVAGGVAARFTPDDLAEMRRILAEDEVHAGPGREATPARDQVQHCLHQLHRFARLAEAGPEPFRAAQYGLNLGRVFTLLGGRGGVCAWWGALGPPTVAEDWAGVKTLVVEYCELLELPRPE